MDDAVYRTWLDLYRLTALRPLELVDQRRHFMAVRERPGGKPLRQRQKPALEQFFGGRRVDRGA